jgi:predicted AlkP superfamily phosphohydrolase/phosphomutase
MSLPFAYIGPGAGFAFATSFFTFLLGAIGGFVSLLLWPVRTAWNWIRFRKVYARAHVRKLIFIGFDGLDARLTEQWLAEGKLPNLARLRDMGGYRRLRTTFPALSPVAWSTFATGVNPAKHNIFDFLSRSAGTYLPELAPAKVRPPARVWKIGRFRIPLSRSVVEGRRRSESFWTILGKHQIRSTVVRVPMTFPPEKFNGQVLSAMCTPDLRGTQGTFSLFTTRLGDQQFEGGYVEILARDGVFLAGAIQGPEGAERVAFRIAPGAAKDEATLRLQGQSVVLRQGEYSGWIRLRFGGVWGVARFLMTETAPEFSLYVSPVQIDPEKPALPISHPRLYAIYLAKLLGTFATLGLAEDTWACNEGAISEQDFLDQAYLIFDERRRMFTEALKRTRRGVTGCVFDTSDRVQHMFFRHLHNGKEGLFSRTIEEMYQRMDGVVGEALQYVDEKTLLVVLSDHGFCRFERGVNLNAWLRDNGYLKLKRPAQDCGKYFDGVDWAGTSAYALGLGGIYLNVRGREPEGIVAPGQESAELKRELLEKLSGFEDAELGRVAIREMYDAASVYRGPYMEGSPDLIAGYNEGYRAAWGAALGEVSGRVFEHNDRPWSGDHCVDPALVPGVLFANRKIDAKDPGIEDLAPTSLRSFGIDPPKWMDGRPVFTF